jgi:hypothetical protein
MNSACVRFPVARAPSWDGGIRNLSFSDRAIDFIQKGERLIIVTLTIAVAGVVCVVAERVGLMSFEGLPSWARPLAQLIWAISAVHVLIHATISLCRGVRWMGKQLYGLPERRRRAVYEMAIVERLLNIGDVEREMICYALYKDENHIWTADRPHDWVLNLRAAGIIDVSSAQWDTVHYEIHPVAWKYMRRYPTKFINVWLWPEEPWVLAEKSEDEIMEIVTRAVAKKSGAATHEQNRLAR